MRVRTTHEQAKDHDDAESPFESVPGCEVTEESGMFVPGP